MTTILIYYDLDDNCVYQIDISSVSSIINGFVNGDSNESNVRNLDTADVYYDLPTQAVGKLKTGIKNPVHVLQNIEESSIDECPICFEIIDAENHVRTKLCGHSFCRNCIVEWFREHTNCPICNKSHVCI